jgi:hypothetical protein
MKQTYRYTQAVDSICYGNVIVSDKDRQVTNRNLLNSIFNILPIFIRRWKIQIYLRKTSLKEGCLHKLLRTLVNTADGHY